ncbi:MAG TPA: ATP-binding protein, partial [Fluviicoccus sp.]|nr:ATP-binding protein [Fluviicoccus sp.]
MNAAAFPRPDYQALFQACPGLYLILTPSLQIIAVSQAYLHATMTRREDILGRQLFDVFPDNPDDPAADGTRNLRASLQRVLKTGRPDTMPIQKYDIRKPASEGGGFEVRYWSPVNSPVIDAQGGVSLLIHAVTDVTEFVRLREQEQASAAESAGLRKLNEQLDADIFQRNREVSDINNRLKQAVSELETANRELESFSYSVSHDLRAPLRAITGFTRMLQERLGDRLDADEQRLLNVVTDNSRLMGQLIDDLLHFSRVTRVSLQQRLFDMDSLVRDVWSEFAPQFPGRMQIDPLPQAGGDSSLLRQVWRNLIGNAVKYTGRAAEPQIRIYADSDDHEIRYHIRDNGAGFDSRFTHKLFNVFQRLHTAEEFPGNGVGLAIVARVIERHGGRIWAEG